MSNDSIRLNIKNDTVQRGTSMYVSITVNSKQYKAIFDIGASTTFMSEAFAKKTGVRLIADSLQIHGGITVYGQSGILDSMQIGDIIVRNIPITINKKDTNNWNKGRRYRLSYWADVMALLGEIQIFPHNGKIVIPTLLTEKPASGSNIYMDNRSLILKGKAVENHTISSSIQVMALPLYLIIFTKVIKQKLMQKVNVLGDLRAELVL